MRSGRSSKTDIYNDIREILRLRDILAALDPLATPTARIVSAPGGSLPPRLGVLAGSFNPLTNAHAALAAAARRAAQLSTIGMLLTKVIVDKEHAEGALLEDRLLVLEQYTASHRGTAVILVNRGLYVEQAEALREQLPEVRELYFIVGFDKILQIFDPRYYDDRDAALRELFARASFLVSPRAGYGPLQHQSEELDKLLALPENRPFRGQVSLLPFSERLSSLSSTQVRQQIAAGADAIPSVPREVVDFVAATRGYCSAELLPSGEQIDCHALRAALIDLLDRNRLWSETRVDFPRLLQACWSDSAAGRELRATVGLGRAAPATALRLLVATSLA